MAFESEGDQRVSFVSYAAFTLSSTVFYSCMCVTAKTWHGCGDVFVIGQCLTSWLALTCVLIYCLTLLFFLEQNCLALVALGYSGCFRSLWQFRILITPGKAVQICNSTSNNMRIYEVLNSCIYYPVGSGMTVFQPWCALIGMELSCSDKWLVTLRRNTMLLWQWLILH